MAYYDDRRHYAPRDRGRSSAGHAADYYDDHPRGLPARHDRDVYSARGGEDSVEEIQRDYPPGSDYVYERGYDSRRSRRPVYENVRRASSVSGYDPYYENGYYRSRTRRSRQYDDRRKWSLSLAAILVPHTEYLIAVILNDLSGPRRSRYSSSSSSSPSPSRHRRRKSFGETALGALGLGSVASRHSDRTDRGRARSSSRRRGRDYSSSRSRSRSRSRDRDRNHRQRSEQRIAQAARAALTAGAVEAFKSRKDPGEWTGAKGKRILTAAVTAAGADGLLDKDPKKHSGRHVVESTLAGLAASHFVGGGRSSSKGRDGRGRSASGLKDLAATGALAAAGKEIYDRISRSRSRPRGRDDRDRDRDSDDGRRGSKKRSKSVSEYLTKGMAALGLGEEASDRGRDDRGRDRDDRYDRRRERRHHRDRDSRYDSYSDSDAESDYRSSRDHRHGRGSRDVGRTRSVNGSRTTPTSAPRGENRVGSTHRGSHSSSESDSDLGDSSDEKEKRKKLKRDMLLTSGLATVATIHAAHGVYGGVQKRKKRMQQVKDGEITQEEARKRRIKANTLDAFSVGLAALGIKGAYAEWKEVNEKRKETKHFQDECAQRARKREMRRCRSQGSAPNSRRRWPDEIEYPNDSRHGHSNGFSYHDGNPYGATSAAPAISY